MSLERSAGKAEYARRFKEFRKARKAATETLAEYRRVLARNLRTMKQNLLDEQTDLNFSPEELTEIDEEAVRLDSVADVIDPDV